ncbi:alpha/beta fold hydrolase [Burkholderia sp. 3C]
MNAVISRWTTAANTPSLHYTLHGSHHRLSPTVVLLHELGGSVASWDGVAAHLAEHFDVLCVDQRGHGLSEKPRAPWALGDLADDLRVVLDDARALNSPASTNAPVWIVGLAAGAASALAYASRHADDVAGLVLCCPALDIDDARRDYLETRAQRAIDEGMQAIADASLARSYPPLLRERLGGDAFAAYRGRFLANDPVSYAYANRALSDARASVWLEAVTGPCLLIGAEHDLLRPPAQVQALSDRTPGAIYAQIDAGHLAAVQAPRALAAMIEAYVRRAR